MTTRFASVLLAALCPAVVLAQAVTDDTQQTSNSISSPVAYLYFSEYVPGHASITPGNTETQVEAYSVAPDGTLTKISGSPFAVGGFDTQMCTNGTYLFTSTHIEQVSSLYPGKMNSYRIGSNGALTLSHVLGNANLTNITLDHTGETLYGTKDNTGDLLSYEVRWSDGGLEYIGQVTANDLTFGQPWRDAPITFSSDNKYAFGTTDASYLRAGNHQLVHASNALTEPISYALAADPNENLAGVVVTTDNLGLDTYGIASYQILPDGGLTTTSTLENVPALPFKSYDQLAMSPSGKFLAVSGMGGVEIYHWNGAAGATHFVTLPIVGYPGNGTDPNTAVAGEVDVLHWDNANHLYGYGSGNSPVAGASNGYLYVWTVTEAGVTNAPGSPLQFESPISVVAVGPGMAVRSLTAQAQ